MKSQQANVQIELKTAIEDDGQLEHSTIKQSGNFYHKNNIDVLTFKEDMEGLIIRNMITIQKDKVSIKRTGSISMNQQFRVNQLTENVYQHPHGNIHMETFTKDMEYLPDNGLLTVNYIVKLNGQEERKHQLVLSFTEEVSQ
ncbi:DUF1934 domain-containing protein [Virgibacillus byunsanensis]|uniref:DUF1934 domain-containing protein n=1 Tax=Virgibacillus byunsanensis TaxID=570945 RepID=A0ABW3LES7_9BACI